MNININKRLTGEGRGGIICPMKSEKNSAGVGTVIARQIACQLRGLATPDRAIFSVIFTPKSLDRPPYSHGTISLLIRWADQFKRGTSYV